MSNIAIIMATYNGKSYIQEQIESIMGNDYQDFTLHICDDGSKDDTLLIVNQLQEKYKEKIVVHRNEKNMGVINNFLYWCKQIDSDYYMFSDQDDVWYKNKISDSLAFIQNKEKSDGAGPIAVYGDAIIVNQNLDIIADSFFGTEGLDTSKNSFFDLLMENKLLGCTVMFNKEVQGILSKIDGIPNGVRMHDWWIGLIASAFGRVYYLDKTLLMYRQHGDNQVGASGVIEYIKENLFKIKEQREKLYAIFAQGEAFLNCYRNDLTDVQVAYLSEFSSFYKKGWMKRRIVFIKNGYRKTGLLRNAGMLFIM